MRANEKDSSLIEKTGFLVNKLMIYIKNTREH